MCKMMKVFAIAATLSAVCDQNNNTEIQAIALKKGGNSVVPDISHETMSVKTAPVASGTPVLVHTSVLVHAERNADDGTAEIVIEDGSNVGAVDLDEVCVNMVDDAGVQRSGKFDYLEKLEEKINSVENQTFFPKSVLENEGDTRAKLANLDKKVENIRDKKNQIKQKLSSEIKAKKQKLRKRISSASKKVATQVSKAQRYAKKQAKRAKSVAKKAKRNLCKGLKKRAPRVYDHLKKGKETLKRGVETVSEIVKPVLTKVKAVFAEFIKELGPRAGKALKNLTFGIIEVVRVLFDLVFKNPVSQTIVNLLYKVVESVVLGVCGFVGLLVGGTAVLAEQGAKYFSEKYGAEVEEYMEKTLLWVDQLLMKVVRSDFVTSTRQSVEHYLPVAKKGSAMVAGVTLAASIGLVGGALQLAGGAAFNVIGGTVYMLGAGMKFMLEKMSPDAIIMMKSPAPAVVFMGGITLVSSIVLFALGAPVTVPCAVACTLFVGTAYRRILLHRHFALRDKSQKINNFGQVYDKMMPCLEEMLEKTSKGNFLRHIEQPSIASQQDDHLENSSGEEAFAKFL